MLLEGKSALVTGAGRGIGRAIALEFARAGADVVLAARSKEQLDNVAAEIQALGRKALAVPTDLGDREQVAALAESALAKFGVIDIAVSNAAISGPFAPMQQTSFEDWKQVQSVNVDGPLSLLLALAPAMIRKGSGSIIVIASIRGLKGVPLGGAYATSMAALISLTKSLACEWGPHGIRVNAICPGPVDTQMVRDAIGEDQALWDRFADLAPLKGWAKPEDCAGPALFLASPAARMVTGHALVVDGGLSAQSPEHFMSV
jgi:NAD(P)-dependent dehydrogenase (short-subunit alcohol dehydrogenase family)